MNLAGIAFARPNVPEPRWFTISHQRMTHGDLTGRLLGEFVLGERIGEGGHGTVYRARQPALGRDVVVKVLRAQRRHSPVAQERFLREAQLASLLDHPYAAHVYAFGVDEPDGLMWIAMELVHGVTLQAWLAAHGPMRLEQLVPFIEHVAQVVHAAHQHGIVHRDLKPSNMMVRAYGDSLFPKLLDFGVAKAPPDIATLPARLPVASDHHEAQDTQPGDGAVEQSTVTSSNAVDSGPPGPLTLPGFGIGSPAYMSPEQWHDAWAVGPAADIYALGVIVYRALAGAEPFVSERTADYHQLHHTAQAPHLDGELAAADHVVQRALAKAPGDRYATALELAADLRAALRTSQREQLRAAAQQWDDRQRSPGLLWGRDELPDLERWARNTDGQLGPLECSFVAASQRRARRLVWLRRGVLVAVVAALIGGWQYRSTITTRARIAEATAAQAELEQGRSALLHGEPEALAHLRAAYAHDPSPSTAFMLARALEPRVAEQAHLKASSGRVWSAAFSPDGRQVVTTDDMNAQLWDAQTNRLQLTLRHGDVVYHAVYTEDGNQLVTGCGDGAVRVWDLSTGTLRREFRAEGPTARYYAVAISRDGRFIAGLSVNLDRTNVWNAQTGQLIAELRAEKGGSTTSLAFSASTRWLAMSLGSDVYVYDTQTWQRTHEIPARIIRSISWDPTGPRLLTGSGKGEVALWQIPSGERIFQLREPGESVDAVAFSLDGRLIAAGSRDGAEQVWNAASGELISHANVRNKILSIEFDRTSSLLVTASSSGIVNVNAVENGMPVVALDGPTAVVKTAHFDPTSQRVVGASWDGTARIWSAISPHRQWASRPLADDCGRAFGAAPDRRFLPVSCREQPSRIYDTAHDRLVAELPAATPVGDRFADTAVSASGDRAALARGDVVEVYALPAARLLQTIEHHSPVTSVAFSATGHDIVSGSVDGSLIVSRDDGTRISLPTSAAAIDAVGFLDSDRVVAVDVDRYLQIYNLGGRRLATLETAARTAYLRIAEDGHRLVTSSTFTGKVVAPELWDVEHYVRIAQLADDDQGQVFSTKFVAGGRVLTACGDGAVRLWDGGRGKLLHTYRGSSRFLADAVMSGDETMVIAGGGGGQLRFWDTSSERLLWIMPAHQSDVVGLHLEANDIVSRGFAGDVARWRVLPAAQVFDACERALTCPEIVDGFP